MNNTYDVIIIGAGAAGLMCAAEAGKRGKRVLVIDHMEKIAEKVRISGGGSCNFTNTNTNAACYISNNPHFCKSALKQYTANDFIDLLKKHDIQFAEKKLGQLFLEGQAYQIIDMLVDEARESAGEVRIEKRTKVMGIEKTSKGFSLETVTGGKTCKSLVIATGGLSIPKIGASNFGYELANQFGINVIPPHAALVPLTFEGDLLSQCSIISGVSVEAEVTCNKTTFKEGLLFTHRGLSGPAILQISSYWNAGDEVKINLAPAINVFEELKVKKKANPKGHINNALAEILPKRLAQSICDANNINGDMGNIPDKALQKLGQAVNAWVVTPSGNEGYRTAEVTRGGVDTNDLSSQTMEAKKQKGLFFIGEVVDVTGHLGGFNFQWAWSSGYVAGQNV